VHFSHVQHTFEHIDERRINMQTTSTNPPSLDDPMGILGAIASHPFLKGIDPRLLTLLISGADPFRFRDGEILARAGSPATSFFLIQSGEVSIETEDGDEVDRIGPGETVGWSWLVPPHQWKFTCKAVGDVSGLRFNADWLRQVCEDHRELGYTIATHLLGVVARRLGATRHALASHIL
jgi:CRP-like cAMP-binding protein